MWLRSMTQEIPSAMAQLCKCGRAFILFIKSEAIMTRSASTSSKASVSVSSSYKAQGGKKWKQRFGGGSKNDKKCSCCSYYSSASALENFPLTGYLLYGTHPAFKTPTSSLSVFKRYKRSEVQLPSPRFLSSTAASEDQFGVNREIVKNEEDFVEKLKKKIFAPFVDIMPSTVDLTKEETVVVSSPSKRKLSPSSSPQQKSPEKKHLKQEQENAEITKMPSSVPSSPLKESNTMPSPTKIVKVESPLKSPMKDSNARRSLGFAQAEATESKLQFAKLTEKAHPPTKGSKDAAGFDLRSAYDYVVPKRGSCLIKTDIQIKVPRGTYGRVAPRSGLALKNKIDVGAGVIDQDYRGNVGVILFNHGDEDFKVSQGDRIAQLICEKIEYPEVEEVKSLDETERGEGGFGSTGVSS